MLCACLQGTLLPAAQRLAKRNPDSVLPSIAALLAAVKADLSAIVPDMMPLLLQMSRHARDTVRYGTCHLKGHERHSPLHGINKFACVGAILPLRHQDRRAWCLRRSSTKEAAQSLSQHVSQPAALTEAVATAQRALQGSLDGKLRQSSEKVGTLAIMSALATAKARGGDLEATAAQATNLLAEYYKEEISEEV